MSIQFSDDAVTEKFFEMADNVAAMKEKLDTHVEDYKEVKKRVDKHETVYKVGKWAAVPALGLLHVGFKHFFSKLGF